MRTLNVFLMTLLLAAVAAAAQETTSPQDLLRRAVALHDAGDYDGAIAIYKQLLNSMPDNENVKYELTFSTFAKGDMAETIRLATEGANRKGPSQMKYLELLGNAYDAQHQTGAAIAAYKRGIKLDPNYGHIHFNLGVTYARQNKLREAREELERAIELDPSHASAHFAIAEVYRSDGYRVPAILAYARFLSISPEGPRAATAANNLQALLNLGVRSEGQGKVNITIDSAAKKDLGDFSALEMMAALASGSAQLPEKAAMSDFDRQSETFSLFLTMLSETAADMKGGFVVKTYVPYYTAMVKAEKASTFAHLALLPLHLAGTDDWMSSHETEIHAFIDWLRTTTH